MNAEDRIRLRHMLDATQEAMSFAKGRTRADLTLDRMLQLSLVKEIEVIGEAASRVSRELQVTTPDSLDRDHRYAAPANPRVCGRESRRGLDYGDIGPTGARPPTRLDSGGRGRVLILQFRPSKKD